MSACRLRFSAAEVSYCLVVPLAPSANGLGVILFLHSYLLSLLLKTLYHKGSRKLPPPACVVILAVLEESLALPPAWRNCGHEGPRPALPLTPLDRPWIWQHFLYWLRWQLYLVSSLMSWKIYLNAHSLIFSCHFWDICKKNIWDKQIFNLHVRLSIHFNISKFCVNRIHSIHSFHILNRYFELLQRQKT